VKSFMLSGSKTERLSRFLTRERAAESCPCSQNIVRQPITARWSAIPWDLCTVPAKISRKGNWNPLSFIPFEVFSMRVFVNTMISPFLDWKTSVRFFICIARRRRPFMNQGGWSIFPSKGNGSPSKMGISFRGRSDVSIFVRTSICWTSDNPGQLNNRLASSVKADTMPNDWTSWLLQQATHVHDWTGHFHSESRIIYQKYLFWHKII
jgi:hypothetical protein